MLPGSPCPSMDCHDKDFLMAGAAPVRVAVVDDDTLMRKAFMDGIDPAVAGVLEAASVEALPAGLSSSVDVLVLDLRLHGAGHRDGARAAGGVQGTAAVRVAAGTGVPVLLYTNEQRPEVLASCLAVGASGLVGKRDPLHVLVEGILQVATGDSFLSPSSAGILTRLQRLRADGLVLTDRQVDVLRLRASGFDRPRIAARLHLSPKTVESHIEAIGRAYADFLRLNSAAQLLHDLGLGPGDLVDPADLPRRRRRRSSD